MNYDVNYFINKFEKIPEEKWNDFIQHDTQTDTRCALGHCDPFGKGHAAAGNETKEGRNMIDIFNSAGYDVHSGNWITDVNNGRSKRYTQPHPKQRILAALYDIRAKQNSQPVSDPYAVSLSQSLACEAVVERREQEVVNEIVKM